MKKPLMVKVMHVVNDGADEIFWVCEGDDREKFIADLVEAAKKGGYTNDPELAKELDEKLHEEGDEYIKYYNDDNGWPDSIEFRTSEYS